MKKQLGGFMIAGGFFGVLYFGYQYLQQTNSFELLGTDIVLTSGELTPVLISVFVMVAGILMSRKL